jgi:hypothetical protein
MAGTRFLCRKRICFTSRRSFQDDGIIGKGVVTAAREVDRQGDGNADARLGGAEERRRATDGA